MINFPLLFENDSTGFGCMLRLFCLCYWLHMCTVNFCFWCFVMDSWFRWIGSHVACWGSSLVGLMVFAVVACQLNVCGSGGCFNGFIGIFRMFTELMSLDEVWWLIGGLTEIEFLIVIHTLFLCVFFLRFLPFSWVVQLWYCAPFRFEVILSAISESFSLLFLYFLLLACRYASLWTA